MYITEIEFGTPEYDETVALRDRILRQPLGLEFSIDDLKMEYRDIHLVCIAPAGEIVGCLILSDKGGKKVKMRQVAVDKPLQKQGIGKMLVEASEQLARHRGYDCITLHARDTAIPFYLNLGYVPVGEPFTEVTIWHQEMEKRL